MSIARGAWGVGEAQVLNLGHCAAATGWRGPCWFCCRLGANPDRAAHRLRPSTLLFRFGRNMSMVLLQPPVFSGLGQGSAVGLARRPETAT